VLRRGSFVWTDLTNDATIVTLESTAAGTLFTPLRGEDPCRSERKP
jgi:hypothetical protein